MARKAMIDQWLPVARYRFGLLAQDTSLLMAWADFLLWAACQTAGPRNERMQARVIANHGPGANTIFRSLLLELDAVVADDPHQNALLKLAVDLGLAERYIYDEEAAEQVFLSRAAQYSEPVAGDPLAGIQAISIQDRDCTLTGGSALIALANVVKRRCPKNYQERAILIAGGADDGYSHMVSYVQMALMGMPCYAALDETQVTDASGLGIFAPANAICSPEFSSPFWMQARWKTVTQFGA